MAGEHGTGELVAGGNRRREQARTLSSTNSGRARPPTSAASGCARPPASAGGDHERVLRRWASGDRERV